MQFQNPEQLSGTAMKRVRIMILLSSGISDVNAFDMLFSPIPPIKEGGF